MKPPRNRACGGCGLPLPHTRGRTPAQCPACDCAGKNRARALRRLARTAPATAERVAALIRLRKEVARLDGLTPAQLAPHAPALLAVGLSIVDDVPRAGAVVGLPVDADLEHRAQADHAALIRARPEVLGAELHGGLAALVVGRAVGGGEGRVGAAMLALLEVAGSLITTRAPP